MRDERKLLVSLMSSSGVAWADVSIPHANFSWIPFTVQKNGRAFRPSPSSTAGGSVTITPY